MNESTFSWMKNVITSSINIFYRWNFKLGNVVMLGINAAGKTTILYSLKLGEIVNTIPTIGLNVEIVYWKKNTISAWDLGSPWKIRPLFRSYYSGVNRIIFGVDSNDRDRFDEAALELQKLLREDELRGLPLLIFANKQDLPDAMSVAEITDKLGMNSLRNRAWYVQGSCATSGDGLYEGLDWLNHSETIYY